MPGPRRSKSTASGWCDLGSGHGITQNGHRFAFIWVGKFVLFTGEVDGVGSLKPNTLAGESCLVGADNFLLEFAGQAPLHGHQVEVRVRRTAALDNLVEGMRLS